MRCGWLVLVCVLLVVGTSFARHDTPRLRHHVPATKAARKEILAAAGEFAFNQAIKQDDKKAHQAFVAGDMEANAKHLAAGDKRRETRDKVVALARVGEGIATGNGAAIARGFADGAIIKVKKERDAATAAHALTQTGHNKQASPDAIKKNDQANMLHLVSKSAKGMDLVNNAVEGGLAIANGVVGAAWKAPSKDSIKKAGQAIQGVAEGAATAGMGAVGLAKQAQVLGLKKDAVKNWDKVRDAVKDGRHKPGGTHAPTTSKPRVIVDAIKNAPKKAGECIGKCIQALKGKPKTRL